MEFLYATVGMLVQAIFMFKREWLFEKKSFMLILLASVILFVLSYVLMMNSIGNQNVVRMLTLPVLSASVFYAMKVAFFWIYKENPDDTFWSMDIGQMRDGIFNALFWILGIMLPVVVTYELLP